VRASLAVTRTLWRGNVPIFTVPWMTDSRIVARSAGGALDGAVWALDAIPPLAASARLIASETTQVHRDRSTLRAAI
jgi:hypothetical protein